MPNIDATLYCPSPFASKNARVEIFSHSDPNYVWLKIYWIYDGVERESEAIKVSLTSLREVINA